MSGRSVAELDIGTNLILHGRRARALEAGARPEKGGKVLPWLWHSFRAGYCLVGPTPLLTFDIASGHAPAPITNLNSYLFTLNLGTWVDTMLPAASASGHSCTYS